MNKPILEATALSLALTGFANAQVPSQEFEGIAAGGFFGSAVDIVGDVDGDGYADTIVGAPGHGGGAGRVQVFSGSTGAAIFTIDGAAGERFGSSVSAAGDVDNDGTPDFIAGAPQSSPNGALSGRATVYSGATGLSIRNIDGQVAGGQLGFDVAGIGNVDGDAFDDFAVSAPFREVGFGTGVVGIVIVYSGADSSILDLFTGDAAGDTAGIAIAGVGDVNGDGRGDIAVGAPNGSAPGGAINGGWVKVLSGNGGFLLSQRGGASTGDRMGSAVHTAGDVDGDGLAEVIVGAPGFNNNQGCALTLRIDSFAGTALYTQVGLPGEQFGRAVSGGADINGDGRSDYLVSAYVEPSGRTLAYSGVDGSVLMEWNDAAVGETAATGGDVDNDGYADVLVGNPYTPGSGPDTGSAILYSGITVNTGLYPGNGGDISVRLGVDGPVDDKSVKIADVGLTLNTEITSPMGTLTGELSLFIVQLFATPGPVPSFPGVPEIHLNPALTLHYIFIGALPVGGENLTFPVPPVLEGISFVGQAFGVAGGMISASDAQVVRTIEG